MRHAPFALLETEGQLPIVRSDILVRVYQCSMQMSRLVLQSLVTLSLALFL
jgi:hypothetical protein